MIFSIKEFPTPSLLSVNSEAALLDFLTSRAIPFSYFEHPPVFTCEEARLYRPTLFGLETKNLFLRDRRHRFYLVVTSCDKQIDIKAFGRAISAPKLQFGNKDQLSFYLGLTPGAVTILGLVNDYTHEVNLLVDSEFWPSSHYLCHPLVNTATLTLDHQALLRFLSITGHQPRVVDIPELQVKPE